jgi:hypothetical protein
VKRIGELRLAQDVLSCQLAILNGSNFDFAKLADLTEKAKPTQRMETFMRELNLTTISTLK